MKRILYKSSLYENFYASASRRTKRKIDDIIDHVEGEEVLNTKFVKKLINSDFYEIRISTENEYRIIAYAINHINIIEATEILILNGFLKKSNLDYIKQINIAKNYIHGNYRQN